MAQKWNLQDIRPAGSSKAPKPRPENQRPQQDIAPKKQPPTPPKTFKRDPDLASIDIVDGKGRKRKRIIISVIIIIVVLGIGFFINTLLGGAEVTVYPKYKDTTVAATFSAYTKPQAGDLGYELLTLEANGERQVTAKGQEQASERAVGTMFIYNAYSESPQRLIKNTRFESPDGLIFRVEESVEVPGYTKDSDGKIVPGVVSTKVFADGTGDQYNIDPARFTIPGLKGTDQYDSMYGESTDAFTGGFEGTRYIIDPNELETTKQSLELELRDALLKRLGDEKPAGFTAFDGAVKFVYDTLPATQYGDQMATIKEHAKLEIPIFKDDELAKFLAQKTVAGYEDVPVLLDDSSKLTFSYGTSTGTTSEDISATTSVSFSLSGKTRIIWQFDGEKLRSDLAGLAKTALPSVLSGYPAIERAEAVVRPFWSQSFPSKPDDIKITTVVGDVTN